MTCIVAIAHEGNVYIGGERGVSDGKYIDVMEEAKVMRTPNNYLFGYAGNIGVGQHVMHRFTFPDVSTPQDMHKIFVPRLKAFFVKSNMDFKEEEDVEFLIGVNGRVYSYAAHDHQLISYKEIVIGSGAGIAYGSLYSTKAWKNQTKRIHTAISAAIHHNINCLGPIDLLSA